MRWGCCLIEGLPIGGRAAAAALRIDAAGGARLVAHILSTRRLSLADEKVLQQEIGRVLAECGIPFEREKGLGDGDICDFLIAGGIALEIKIKGGKVAIYRQCRRYCAHDEVRALILATAVAMGLPPTIDGKPAVVASLSEGWL